MAVKNQTVDDDWDLGDRWTDRRDTVFERPTNQQHSFAPATLPRQATPLVSRFKPDLPTSAPVSIIPSMSNTSFPDAEKVPEDAIPTPPVIGTLISVGAPTEPPPPVRKVNEQPSESEKAIEVPSKQFSISSTPRKEKGEKLVKKEKKKEKKTARRINLLYGQGGCTVQQLSEVLNEMDSDTSSIDSRDPFGAAPFDQLTVSTSSSAPPISLPPGSFHSQSSIAPSSLLRHDKLRLEEKGSSELETDGSEAEIWTTDGPATFSKKKKKSTFGLRSSHPSIVSNDLQLASPMPVAVKKSSREKKSMTGRNASFVNTSFQPEDHDGSNDI
uniref:CARMIL_C domain-containing protein n=1 Tax=Caenorhabditis tropicalis TaxID=1561998 RepID=A0A1I7T2C5_9PELO